MLDSCLPADCLPTLPAQATGARPVGVGSSFRQTEVGGSCKRGARGGVFGGASCSAQPGLTAPSVCWLSHALRHRHHAGVPGRLLRPLLLPVVRLLWRRPHLRSGLLHRSAVLRLGLVGRVRCVWVTNVVGCLLLCPVSRWQLTDLSATPARYHAACRMGRVPTAVVAPTR
jgi:hypothetical protein